MKRLKELRQAGRYSQQQLAEMLGTTQQTIGRWESGAVEPNLSKLRDIALIFGVSVDDLLGANPISTPPPSTHYHLFGDGAADGFWGHVGLLLDGELQTTWFPITASVASQIRNALHGEDTWISFTTLANKIVAMQPASVRKIWLLDDACDGPEGDWEPPNFYEGLPLEVFRAFGDLIDAPLSPNEIEGAVQLLPSQNPDGSMEPGDPKGWKAFADHVSEIAFGGEASEIFVASVVSAFVKAGIHDPDQAYRRHYYSTVHLSGGERHEFWAEADGLCDLLDNIEMEAVPSMIYFEHFGGAAETFFPTNRVSAVIMPLVEILDEQKARDEA